MWNDNKGPRRDQLGQGKHLVKGFASSRPFLPIVVGATVGTDGSNLKTKDMTSRNSIRNGTVMQFQ